MAGLFKKKNDAEENAGGNVSKQDVFSKQENANRGIGSRLKELFSGTKGKRLARGTNMTVLVAAVVAIAVILNLLLELVPLNIDLTTEKLYTLTEVTEKVLDELKNDVTVYALYDRLAGETDSNANTAQIIKVARSL